MGKLTFRESASVLIHKFLLYIQGVEVSNHTTGTLSWGLAGRDGNNTCSFTLDNAYDKWVLSKDNLNGSWRDGDIPYSEQEKRAIYNFKSRPGKNPIDKVTGERKWPLRPNRLIFHKYDPVRLFIMDPYSDPVDNRWMPEFTGYVDSATFDDSYTDGTRNVSISCGDFKTILEKMRVQVNVTDGRIKDEPIYLDAESDLFRDFVFDDSGLQYSHIFAKRAFEDVVSLLILGVDSKGYLRGLGQASAGRFRPGRRFALIPTASEVSLMTGLAEETATVTADTKVLGEVSATGAVVAPDSLAEDLLGTVEETQDAVNLRLQKNPKFIVFEQSLNLISEETYTQNAGIAGDIEVPVPGDDRTDAVNDYLSQGTDQVKTTLDVWNRLILFGDGNEGTTNSRTFWTQGQCRKVGKGCKTGGKFAPDSGELHMLLPDGSTEWKSLVEVQNFNVSNQRDWVTRAEMIRQVAEIINYEWYCTPNGDMVVELPQYDFIPSFYRGVFPHDKVSRVDQMLISDSIGDETGNVPSAVVVIGGQSAQQAKYMISEVQQPRAWITSNLMAGRFGVQVEPVVFPWTEDLDLLCQLAAVEYAKKLSEANTASFEAAYRPFYLPNRPVEIVPRERMGTSSAITHTLNIGNDASTSVDLQYIRRKNKKGRYVLITGTEEGPNSYRNHAGVGQLVSTNLSTKCQIPENVIDVLGNLERSRKKQAQLRGAVSQGLTGYTEDEMRAMALTAGIPVDQWWLAYMMCSETSGQNFKKDEMVNLGHTVYNRIAFNDTVRRDWSTVPKVIARTKSGEVRTGKQAKNGREYSTNIKTRKGGMPAPSPACLDAAEEVYTLRSVSSEYPHSSDPTQGADHFVSPSNKNVSYTEAVGVKSWEEDKFVRVRPKNVKSSSRHTRFIFYRSKWANRRYKKNT